MHFSFSSRNECDIDKVFTFTGFPVFILIVSVNYDFTLIVKPRCIGPFEEVKPVL